jgi:glycine betaine/proline transport system substrate-binding protein
MQRITRYVIGLVAAIGLFGGIHSTANAGVESTDPIKITLHDWTGQYLSANIMAEILKNAGYNIELVQADYLAQFAGLESGDLHVSPEIWETTAKDIMAASFATGKTVDLGSTGMSAKEEWWYPLYMKERCPGLPDWKAMNACAEAFSIAETAPKGRYVGGPSTWGGHDDERVEALGLDFEVVHAGTDAAMFAELESAYQRQAPIVLWVYSPHWAPAKYEGEFVEFPEYTDECYSDPSWGINPDMAYDCGKPFGVIKRVGWAGGEDKWPGAYKIIRAMEMTDAEMNAMVAAVDLNGESVDDVVADWMTKNEARWSAWIE